ncbi:MAG: hypothetical protein RR585_08370 [Coprobacillus sp.]
MINITLSFETYCSIAAEAMYVQKSNINMASSTSALLDGKII